MTQKSEFDHDLFYSAVDGARQSRKVTWSQVAKEANVSQSTLTRLAQGKRPDVDSLAALVSWADLDANSFVTGHRAEEKEPEPLSRISGFLRADKNLTKESAEAIDAVVKATYEALRTKA